jgi:hypothetical protein
MKEFSGILISANKQTNTAELQYNKMDDFQNMFLLNIPY